MFNIETNTAQPDDTAIGAATLAVSTVPDPTSFTTTKAAVGVKPDSTTTITTTRQMMTLVGVTVVSQQQPIQRVDFNSAKRVWGRQLGNIPQANIGDTYCSAGCSLNPSQMQHLYTIISALEGINVQPKYSPEWASKNWTVSYIHNITINKQNWIGRKNETSFSYILITGVKSQLYLNSSNARACKHCSSSITKKHIPATGMYGSTNTNTCRNL